MNKKVISLLLSMVTVASMLGGCGNKKSNTQPSKTSSETQSTEANTATSKAPSSSQSAEIEKWPENVTLKWYIVAEKEPEYVQTLWNEMESIKAIEEATNINIEFEVITNYDSYLPMMTSATYPDIITAKNMMKYPGRLPAMFKDGISIQLDELIDKYMPNLKNILEEHPQMANDLKLDSGEYTYFSRLFDLENEEDRVSQTVDGLVIRKDWLDAVGKDVPTTMDEWYEVLKAFKTQDPNGNGIQDEEPLSLGSSGWKYFLCAYGIGKDATVQEDGTVIYGMGSEYYKGFLEEMNKWYSEGLIYNMFDGTSLEIQEERVINNLAGAWKGRAEQLNEDDSYLSKLKEKVPNAEFVAAPWPKTADGTHYNYFSLASFSRDTTVITSNCKNPEAAAFLIDYLYSEEGSKLLNWGIEGESYEVVNGEMKIKEEMFEEVDYNGTKIQRLKLYIDPQIMFLPSFGQYSKFILSTKSDAFINACTIWSKGEDLTMPYPIMLSPEQDDKVNEATEGMIDYINTMRQKYVLGEEPFSSFDTYLDQVDLLGLPVLEEVWQESYDAYKAR
ncbi:MAG: extracellular solute-binding protein [Lachnospiraceae bacterium]